jgi:hypothetical protein
MKKDGIEWNGRDYEAVTVNLVAGSVVGDALTAVAGVQGQVGRGTSGDTFLGKLHKIDDADGKGTFQMDGEMSVGYSGTALVPSSVVFLQVDGAGKVKTAATGRQAFVAAVDTTTTTAIIWTL